MRRTRVIWLALAIGSGGFAACTTFDGLAVPTNTKPPDGGGPPQDGGPPPLDGTLPDGGPKVASYLSIDDAARLCSLLDKCPALGKSITFSLAIELDPLNYSLCVDWLAGPIPSSHVGTAGQAASLQCAATANSCLGSAACLSQEFLDVADTRCNKVPKDAGADASPGVYQYCDSDASALVRCDPQFVYDVLHCGSGYFGPGATCLTASDGTKSCAVGTDCPTTSCGGNLLTYCAANGTHQVENCANVGQTCGLDVTDDSGVPTCITGDRVKTCASAGSDCVGEVISVCDGFDRGEFDCAALGGSCSKTSGTARCTRPGDSCGPEDPAVNVCTGSKISLCVGGKPTTFDCAKDGLGCIAGSGGRTPRCG